MDAIEATLRAWQLHPVADHFTIAIITAGILADLMASLMPARTWLRNMAATLMVIGAAAAAASYFSGEVEADRVWKMLLPAAKQYFSPKGIIAHQFGHGALGTYLTYAFAVMALWRLAIQWLGFMARTRATYLSVAMAALGLVLYQGHTGGTLVYTYGVGTGAMAPGAPAAAASEGAGESAPAAISQPSTAAAAEPTQSAKPTETAPATEASPTPEPAPSPTATQSAPAPSPAAAASGTPGHSVLVITPTPTATPLAKPEAPAPSPLPTSEGST